MCMEPSWKCSSQKSLLRTIVPFFFAGTFLVVFLPLATWESRGGWHGWVGCCSLVGMGLGGSESYGSRETDGDRPS